MSQLLFVESRLFQPLENEPFRLSVLNPCMYIYRLLSTNEAFFISPNLFIRQGNQGGDQARGTTRRIEYAFHFEPLI